MQIAIVAIRDVASSVSSERREGRLQQLLREPHTCPADRPRFSTQYVPLPSRPPTVISTVGASADQRSPPVSGKTPDLVGWAGSPGIRCTACRHCCGDLFVQGPYSSVSMMLAGRVQHGLTPPRLGAPRCSLRVAPNVMVKWLSIS